MSAIFALAVIVILVEHHVSFGVGGAVCWPAFFSAP